MIKLRSQHKLQEILDTILEEVHPQRVILFGSQVKGSTHEDSDYDFMIIKKNVTNER